MTSSDERLNRVFECIVRHYIDSAQPVGSRAVSKIYDGNLSPASIRSVMADLEEMGFLTHPHTSAGRVPTQKGYRFYVDSLMEPEEVDCISSRDIAQIMNSLHNDIEDTAESLTQRVAETTQSAAILLLKNVKRHSYLEGMNHTHPEDESEEAHDVRVYINGTRYLLEEPEFSEIDRARPLMRALELKQSLIAVLLECLHDERLRIRIGEEMESEGLSDASMVTKEYFVRGVPIGCLAVIGPTRMRYSRAVGAVSQFADAITDFLNDV